MLRKGEVICAGVDPGFSLAPAYDFAKFFEKRYEIGKLLVRRWRPFLDPPLLL